MGDKISTFGLVAVPHKWVKDWMIGVFQLAIGQSAPEGLLRRLMFHDLTAREQMVRAAEEERHD